jgi:uncharacterized protein (DUF2147 family)
MLFLYSEWLVKIAIHLSLGIGAVSVQNALMGTWREPTGSVIEIHPCGNDLCLRLVSISSKAPTQRDERNPDPSLRSRPLCRLEIGKGFHPEGEDKANDGALYDPKSGRTYRGSMARVGDKLYLRGYFGIKLFGATETWMKADAVSICKIPPS